MDVFTVYSQDKATDEPMGGYGYQPRMAMLPPRPRPRFARRAVTVSHSKAKRVRDDLGLNPDAVSVDTMRRGLEVELEHGSMYGPNTNITGDNMMTTGRIVVAHLEEFQDYYDRLEVMETEAKAYWEDSLETTGPPPPLYLQR